MAVTTLTPPESITFDLDHERKKCIVSGSRYSTYSTLSSSPELTSPGHATYSKNAIITPESDGGQDSPQRVVPKLEEVEDDGAGALSKLAGLEDAKTLPRKRGRPRIHPAIEQKKASHARSKTGCGTCRRRKKKCDEARPHCQNCAKNNVICAGYDEKKMWRSGKQKASETRTPPMMPALPPGFAGVDTPMDYRLLEYFTYRVATVLSVTDKHNPFTAVILPMAVDHKVLMMSLLYLSGSCLVANESDPSSEMVERVAEHGTKSFELLNESLTQLRLADEADEDGTDKAVASVGDPSLAATLLLCLQTVCAGTLDGTWRLHVQAMKVLLSHKPHMFEPDFRRFVLEFLLYHDYSSSVTSLSNPLDNHSVKLMEELLPTPMVQPEDATLLGVMDGLFGHISRIRQLRDQIRERRRQGIVSEVHPPGWLLQDELQKWQCHYAQGTPRFWASLLYRQCVYLYLHRTIRESKPCLQFERGVDEGLQYLRQLPQEQDDNATQSILLMPVFLLGCCAFKPEQRPEITQAFERLQKWSTLGNIKHAKVIVEEIWEMMDDGRAEETWDWEAIMAERDWDFLVT